MDTRPPLPSRREVIARVHAAGRRVAAVLPYHYPRPLLRAHGFHPIEVWGPPGVPRDEGGRHFQAYTCDIVVRATSFLHGGGLDGVDALLIPHTCDALQGMGSVLGDFIRPTMPVLTLYLPRGRRPADADFLAAELRRLGTALSAVSGMAPGEGEWAEAFAVEDAADRALAGLYARRGRLAAGDRGFYAVVRAREFLPAEDFPALAASLPDGDPPGGIPLMLSGIAADPLDLFDHLAGGARRLYRIDTAADPWALLAARLLSGPPDPTRGDPIADRARWLIAQMAASGARGLVVYDPKFCEPELFDLPRLRRRLGEAGYPLLHVEVELSGALSQQTLTRLEAFVETLR
jgi:benzoyl-CoA reductase/2-hydroxyglutaryl-CoA dehydratase subunit BcrC/BadD/HgdB